MAEKNPKSPTYEQFYDYFVNGIGKPVGVISSKQCVLRDARYFKEASHFEMSKKITKDMGYASTNGYSGVNRHNVHLFGNASETGLVVDILLPEFDHHRISLSQYAFLNDILNAYEDAQKSPDSNKEFNLNLFSNSIISSDIDRMRAELKNKLERDVYINHAENILSADEEHESVTTHDISFQELEILANLNLAKTESYQELFSKINIIGEKFAGDSYYQAAVKKLFPEYDKIKAFCEFGKKLGIDAKVEDLSHENILNKLTESLNVLTPGKPHSVLAEGYSILNGPNKNNQKPIQKDSDDIER